jgi:hypothetical protein
VSNKLNALISSSGDADLGFHLGSDSVISMNSGLGRANGSADGNSLVKVAISLLCDTIQALNPHLHLCNTNGGASVPPEVLMEAFRGVDVLLVYKDSDGRSETEGAGTSMVIEGNKQAALGQYQNEYKYGIMAAHECVLVARSAEFKKQLESCEKDSVLGIKIVYLGVGDSGIGLGFGRMGLNDESLQCISEVRNARVGTGCSVRGDYLSVAVDFMYCGDAVLVDDGETTASASSWANHDEASTHGGDRSSELAIAMRRLCIDNALTNGISSSNNSSNSNSNSNSSSGEYAQNDSGRRSDISSSTSNSSGGMSSSDVNNLLRSCLARARSRSTSVPEGAVRDIICRLETPWSHPVLSRWMISTINNVSYHNTAHFTM